MKKMINTMKETMESYYGLAIMETLAVIVWYYAVDLVLMKLFRIIPIELDYDAIITIALVGVMFVASKLWIEKLSKFRKVSTEEEP